MRLIKKYILIFLGLFLVFLLGNSIRRPVQDFLWEHPDKKYLIFPWLYPQNSELAEILFDESVCSELKINNKPESPSVISTWLLEIEGYKVTETESDGPEGSIFTADFSKNPLFLTIPELGIKDWKIVKYTVDFTDPSIEVLENIKKVAKLIRVPSNGDSYTVRISPYGFSMLNEKSIILKPTSNGTRITRIVNPVG